MRFSWLWLLLPLFILSACSDSTSSNSGGTTTSLRPGTQFTYDTWGYDLRTGDSIGFTRTDTVLSTTASYFGVAPVVRYNDSAMTMLPFSIVNESVGMVLGMLQGPAYYRLDASGDVAYPAVVSTQDTAGHTDSTMTWWKLPFASKTTRIYTVASADDVESRDTILSLPDSTFIVGSASYPTKRIEIHHVIMTGSGYHIRVAFSPALQTIVQTTWLIESPVGGYVTVGAKSLTGTQ